MTIALDEEQILAAMVTTTTAEKKQAETDLKLANKVLQYATNSHAIAVTDLDTAKKLDTLSIFYLVGPLRKAVAEELRLLKLLQGRNEIHLESFLSLNDTNRKENLVALMRQVWNPSNGA